MTIFALSGWVATWICAVGYGYLCRKWDKTAQGLLGDLADSQQVVLLLQYQLDRLTPKHDKDGKFARKVR